MINSNNQLVTEKLPLIGSDAFTVFFVILSHLRVDRKAWPGIDRICKMAPVMVKGKLRPMPKKRAYAAIKMLVDASMITRHQKRLPNGDWGRRTFIVTESYVNVFWNITDTPLEEQGDGLVEFGESINDQTEPIDKGELPLKEKESENEKIAILWGATGEERFKASYSAVVDHLKQNPNAWSDLCNQAMIKLDKAQFNAELTLWLRHHQDNVSIMQQPIRRLTGGRGSFFSWLCQPMCKKKYSLTTKGNYSKPEKPVTLPAARKPALPGRETSPESSLLKTAGHGSK